MQQRRRTPGARGAAPAPQRPAAAAPGPWTPPSLPAASGRLHPLTRADENARLFDYERRSKEAFDRIEPVLRRIAQYQHQGDFAERAREIARVELGFEPPLALLENTWIAPLDMAALYAWCVFATVRRFADEFFLERPLAHPEDSSFQAFLEECGFHLMDVSPCADGRLAHIVRYVLRLPHRAVRRKSYAGAMFNVEDSLQKWVETEFLRQREARPNPVDAPTRYLKVAVYHYSGSQPDHEGCAAHGSDAGVAAEQALVRLLDFQAGVENSFCCGASIDLLLVGIDTDNDTLRVHLPDAHGALDTGRYVDAREVYQATLAADPRDGERAVREVVAQMAEAQQVRPAEGMLRLITRLLLNNISQIDYVRSYFQGRYADIGHHERFIGMGIGFEEVQLRNLTYFAYLQTVEQGAKDLDVGVKIFTGLNLRRGLPAPVVIRYDYHGNVPGARERAVARCHCLEQALLARFREQAGRGLLHTLLVVRDLGADGGIEVVGGSVERLIDERSGSEVH